MTNTLQIKHSEDKLALRERQIQTIYDKRVLQIPIKLLKIQIYENM
jgi:hypothetical protein